MSDFDVLRRLRELENELDALRASTSYDNYRGTSGVDFTTTTLPQHGDYGYQTADAEVQMNCNGTILAISTAAL